MLLTKVQHVHVIVAYRSVPATKHIDLPLLHHTCRMTARPKKTKNKEEVKNTEQLSLKRKKLEIVR